jgi:DNA ligase D-like protein (predicted 3'-phosphoesterase)
MPRFVVHDHKSIGPAGHHHDLRIEHKGTLKSWSIPKLIEPRTDAKRLAIKVVDHNLEYIDFEGEITEGYGAGTVGIWDTGEYEFVKPPDDGISYKIRFYGQKLQGVWVIRRMKPEEDNFLFFKAKDQG